MTSATVAPNVGSNRIHEKCGYQRIGIHRHQFLRDGTLQNEILWELFAEEFAEIEHRALVHATHPPCAEHDDGVAL